MLTYRLTDPDLRENYLTFGHSDGNSYASSASIALPEEMIKTKSWSCVVLFTYLSLLVILTPCCLEFLCQTQTINELHETTAHRFFAATMNKRCLDYLEMVSMLSMCHEIVTVVQSRRESKISLLAQFYNILSFKQKLQLNPSVYEALSVANSRPIILHEHYCMHTCIDILFLPSSNI
jgi:preprotein translocase subunit Sec63